MEIQTAKKITHSKISILLNLNANATHVQLLGQPECVFLFSYGVEGSIFLEFHICTEHNRRFAWAHVWSCLNGLPGCSCHEKPCCILGRETSFVPLLFFGFLSPVGEPWMRLCSKFEPFFVFCVGSNVGLY